MKRTKSMVYTASDNSRELTLYANNTYDLYRRFTIATIANLRKKAIKGNYNTEKAIDAWYAVATQAAKMYCKEFTWNEIVFSVTDRFTTACDLEEYYRDMVFEGIEEEA